MATYYGVKGSSNWNAGNWSTTAAKDATRTGSGVTPLATDDCILDDWTSDGGGVTWTIDNTACACKTLTCTGYAGDIAFTATKILSVSGSCTFAATHTLSGTGNLSLKTAGTLTTAGIASSITTLTISASVTLNTSGTTWNNITYTGGSTYTTTLTSKLDCTGTLSIGSNNVTFSGAFSITCGTLSGGSVSVLFLTFVAGETITVSTAINLSAASFVTFTVRSGTASSDTFLHFNGVAADCKIAGVTFTDVNCAHDVLNWHGGTLTRTTNIYNVTAASFPAVGDVEGAVEYGGVDDAAANRLTGTFVVPAVADVRSGTHYGAAEEFTGELAAGGGATVGPFEVGPFR